MNDFIELSNINKFFDNLKKTKVLKKISYKFKKGKIYSIMGPSGSGKSTLLNLISLIDRPTSGTLIINNKQINFNEKTKNDILRANKIGIIYQQDNLLSDFTALENVYLSSLAAGKDKKLSLTKANLLLKKVGLKILSGVKSFLTRSVSNVFRFLGAEPEIRHSTRIKF